MSLGNDLKILYHLVLRPVRGKTHSERMESFYAGQAEGYDDFRKRLLQGREDVYREVVDRSAGGIWVDMGGGTGSNLEFAGDGIRRFEKVYVVDLAESLLGIVKKRSEKNGWSNVEAVVGDATQWLPPEGSADVVTFSYSLTMIPDWFAAIDNALRMLKPGGLIGVIDFYVCANTLPIVWQSIVGARDRFGRYGLPTIMSFRARITCPIFRSISKRYD